MPERRESDRRSRCLPGTFARSGPTIIPSGGCCRSLTLIGEHLRQRLGRCGAGLAPSPGPPSRGDVVARIEIGVIDLAVGEGRLTVVLRIAVQTPRSVVGP